MTKELKDALEYTEDTPPTCNACAFVSCKTDFGGGEYLVCRLNPAFSPTVSSRGRCKFFDKKVSTPTIPT